MKNPILRLVLALIAVAAAGGAGYFVFTLEQRAGATRNAERAFAEDVLRLQATLAEVRAAQAGYLATGQDAAVWIEKVSQLRQQAETQLKRLAAAPPGPEVESELATVGESLASLGRFDKRVAELLRGEQTLTASALIFTNSAQVVTAATTTLSNLRGARASKTGAALSETRKQQVYAMAGAAALVFLVLLLLVPGGRRSREDYVDTGEASALGADAQLFAPAPQVPAAHVGLGRDLDLSLQRRDAPDGESDRALASELDAATAGAAQSSSFADGHGTGVAQSSSFADGHGTGVAQGSSFGDGHGAGVAQSSSFADGSRGGVAQSSSFADGSRGGVAQSSSFADGSRGGVAQSSSFADGSRGGVAQSSSFADGSRGGVAQSSSFAEQERDEVLESLDAPGPRRVPPPTGGARSGVDRAAAPAFRVDLAAAAQLCTDLARVRDTSELQGLLARAATLLDASGIVVWMGGSNGDVLWPAFSHGYTPHTLSRMQALPRDGSTPVSVAFRTGLMEVVRASDGDTSGAIVAPILTSTGCVGVMAVEIRHGAETSDAEQALAGILAAQLATLVAGEEH